MQAHVVQAGIQYAASSGRRSTYIENHKSKDGRKIDGPAQRRNDTSEKVQIRITYGGKGSDNGLRRVREPARQDGFVPKGKWDGLLMEMEEN